MAMNDEHDDERRRCSDGDNAAMSDGDIATKTTNDGNIAITTQATAMQSQPRLHNDKDDERRQRDDNDAATRDDNVE